jgi:hypothetical protein
VARGLVQTACTSLNVFFSSVGLTISASKSEVMLFTTPANTGKNRILCATSDDMFQIFGYIFRWWVAMELPCEVCTAKMPHSKG